MHFWWAQCHARLPSPNCLTKRALETLILNLFDFFVFPRLLWRPVTNRLTEIIAFFRLSKNRFDLVQLRRHRE